MANLEKLLCTELKRQLEAKGPQIVRTPAGGELLWRWFLDLNRTRRSGFGGPEPISYVEIEAYNHLTGWGLEPRHVAILLAMDGVWLEHVHKRAAQTPEGVKASPPIAQHQMTAGMFDAMFGGR